MLIILNALILLLFECSLVICDCGIPGVPAFARVIRSDSSGFNVDMTSYPEGYAIKYDCLPYGLNINGIESRTCRDSVWQPWQLPFCGIEKLAEFALEIKYKNQINRQVFQNNLQLFSDKANYIAAKAQYFTLNVSTGSYLWKIKFAHKYQVERDHSLLAVLLFVLPNSGTYNHSAISVDIDASTSLSTRSCKSMTQVGYVRSLFSDTDGNNAVELNDKFYKITLECRNSWFDSRVRWHPTSDKDDISELNLNLTANTSTEVAMILMQLSLNVDCGYPDAAIHANYTKQWGNAMFSCMKGELSGNSEVTCNSNGQWNQTVPRCCVDRECEIRSALSVVWIIIITLSAVVILLAIMAVVLFVRSVKRQKLADIERAKRQLYNLENYDDIVDENYDQIDEQQYDEIDYSMIGKCDYTVIGKCELEMYDDNIEARYTVNARKTCNNNSNNDDGYVHMKSYDDGYVKMTANTSTTK